MLISQNWLSDLLRAADQKDFQISAPELDDAFVRVGFETEGYEPIAETTGDLVIGRVDTITELTEFKKPIRYCLVDVGQANGTGELQGIICGARNFEEGDLVVVALPGTVLPGGFEISARETYGHISNGMICSASELGFTERQNSGIITLEQGTPGEDAREIVGVADTVFEVNVTPDRGYALSMRGLTREIASSLNLNFVDPAADPSVAGLDLSAVPSADGTVVDLNIEALDDVHRFGIRKVTGTKAGAESPFWLQRQLMLSGVRPVNAATDVTNWVMILLGQPMHAFDADVISGGLTVRKAQAGEQFETLDHVVRTLSEEDIVICDDNGIQSMAGVMGGTTSEISDETTEVFFEAANFKPRTIARTSRRHKLSSESSRRFERTVDPALVEVALDIASALLVKIAGGEIVSGRSLHGEVELPQPVTLRADHPKELIGVDFERSEIISHLEEVGCEVADLGEELAVTPPTWRSDLKIPEDLIEEIMRLHGLDDIPLLLPTPSGGTGLTVEQKRKRAIGHALAYNGYAEILPTPFMQNNVFDVWGLDEDDKRRKTVQVRNPLDSDYSVLATTLLPAMLEVVARNVARGRRSVTLFGLQQVAYQRAEKTPMPDVDKRPEPTTVDELLSSLPEQPVHVATVAVGEVDFTGPWGEGRAYSWADAIESARVVARAAGVTLEVRAGEQLPWHPGRCAELLVDGQSVGYAGELHPQLLEDVGLPPRTCAMELNIDALGEADALPAPVLSAYPSLHQDIALVVDENIPAETVRKVIAEGAGELLESVELFDVFRGSQLGENKKSLAFELQFRAADRTLTDEEANARRLAAAELAAERFGAEMRA